MLDSIYKNYKELSESQKQVINYIYAYKDIRNLKLKHIKDRLYVSNSTIIRACKKMGFMSFNEFKFSLIDKTNKKEEETNTLDFVSLKNRMKEDINRTFDLLDDAKIEEFVEAIVGAKRIFCIGYGNSSIISRSLSRNLQLIGLFAISLEENKMIEMMLEASSQGDLVVVLSLSGENEDLNKRLLSAKKKGVIISSITNLAENSLEKISDINLYTYSSSNKRQSKRTRLSLYIATSLIFEHLLLKLKK